MFSKQITIASGKLRGAAPRVCGASFFPGVERKSFNKRGCVLGLVEKLQSELSGTDYLVKECVYSSRKQLEIGSAKYCLLSGEAGPVYCPLQAAKGDGDKLSACLRDDYLRELCGKNKILK
jgi:hypothetical protein